MNLADALTVSRIVLLPWILFLILSHRFVEAFAWFAFAGFSDFLDGFLARKYRMGSFLGAVLDPLADKLLLVGVYAALAFVGVCPLWLFLLILARDFLILLGVGLAVLLKKPLEMKPILVSKYNTLFQILLAGTWLISPFLFGDSYAENRIYQVFFWSFFLATFCLTIASFFLYTQVFLQHMGVGENKKQ